MGKGENGGGGRGRTEGKEGRGDRDVVSLAGKRGGGGTSILVVENDWAGFSAALIIGVVQFVREGFKMADGT